MYWMISTVYIANCFASQIIIHVYNASYNHSINPTKPR